MAASVACRSTINFLKLPKWGLLTAYTNPIANMEDVRHRRTKHWNPAFKKLRTLKVIKVNLPNFNEKNEDLTEEQIRSRMKKQGMLPPRPWMERTFHISCTGAVFEPYIPPEGDGKRSIVTGPGAKQKIETLEKKSKQIMTIRKIRSFDEDFDTKEFATIAQDIYVQAHTYLAENDKLSLRTVATERCYPELRNNTKYKTIHWKFLQSLEPPRVVHARCTHVITKDNVFAQVTVRFHTQQQLAVYDRFGRLMHGSEIIAKDVLEYVVFEKHLSNLYGKWRIHAKIIPDWLPPREPSPVTYCKPEKPIDVGISAKEQKQDDALETVASESNPDKPALATA